MDLKNIAPISQLAGAYHFPELLDLGIKNYFTYDNKLWGNMNPTLTDSKSEKEQISQKDKLLANYIGASKIYVMTTPPENTIIQLSQEEHTYLQHYYPEKYINIRANSIILPKDLKNFHIVFAPSDCAIVVLVSNTQIIAMHLGASQVLTGLHFNSLKFLIPKSSKTIKVFIFPYICAKHYSINADKITVLLKTMEKTNPERVELIKKYLGKTVFVKNRPNADKKTNKTTSKNKRIYFDFMGLFKHETKNFLQTKYNLNIIFQETNLCTYEHAIKYNNLFSYTARKQGKQKPGCFNVGIGRA